MTAQKPNIILIITDQQRYDTIGALGASWVDTPNLDRLVKEGITFTDCHITGSSCVPSRGDKALAARPEETAAGTVPAACRLSRKAGRLSLGTARAAAFGHVRRQYGQVVDRAPAVGPLWRKHDADRRAHRRRPGVAGPAGLPRQHAVVLFCSDHGDCLGEHGLIQKWAPYDCITRTPLIAWSRQGLGAGAGATVEGLCQLFDVGPTILDLAGCATAKTYEARSLYPDCAGMRQQLLDNLREWLLQSNYVTRDYQAQAR